MFYLSVLHNKLTLTSCTNMFSSTQITMEGFFFFNSERKNNELCSLNMELMSVIHSISALEFSTDARTNFT